MANLFLGLNRGQTEKDIVTGSATGSKDVEVRIDDSKSWKKSEILAKLDEIKNYFLTHNSQFQ